MSRLLTTESKIANMFCFKPKKKKKKNWKKNQVSLIEDSALIHFTQNWLLLKFQVLLEMVLLFESGFMNNKTYPLDSHSSYQSHTGWNFQLSMAHSSIIHALFPSWNLTFSWNYLAHLFVYLSIINVPSLECRHQESSALMTGLLWLSQHVE